jgi:hypothetical protein
MSSRPEDPCKDGPPIKRSLREATAVWQDRADDLAFVALVLPLLDPEAVARASDVRLKPGDPARGLVRPARLLPIRGQS